MVYSGKKKNGNWYRGAGRGVLEAAERFMARWHDDETQLRRQHRASAVGGARGIGWSGGKTRNGRRPDQGNAARGGGQEEEQRGKHGGLKYSRRRRRQTGYQGSRPK